MRASGVRDVLIYCRDHRCSHHVETNADGWPDDVRLSDIEPSFTCTRGGKPAPTFGRRLAKRGLAPVMALESGSLHRRRNVDRKSSHRFQPRHEPLPNIVLCETIHANVKIVSCRRGIPSHRGGWHYWDGDRALAQTDGGRLKMHIFYPSSLLQLIILSTTLSSVTARADYVQTNLVSDIPGFASITDPNLNNPWGVSHSATSPFWISDQGTSVSTLYSVIGGNVAKVPLTVAIPTTATGPRVPPAR